jgi:hypothetical protein
MVESLVYKWVEKTVKLLAAESVDRKVAWRVYRWVEMKEKCLVVKMVVMKADK